ncbi:MAG: hypothetical protein WAW39_16030 [Prosthecobacter sp.]|uniref:hypothetical protein n=1 Tax=Prosthecobacter sp. TaxID=1965333 RepID=UPI003BB03625
MSTLATLSGTPLIKEYAQGAAQSATSSVADFIAPTVNTTKHTGKFTRYDKESRFKIPDTLRGLGGNATRLVFDRSSATFECKPNALDTPLDNIEIDEAEGMDVLKEAADDSAFLGGLAHEKLVIDTAVSSAAAATGGTWSSDSNDPVAELNEAIAEVILASGGSDMIEIGMVWSADAVRAFFKNAKTKSYFPGKQEIAPTLDNIMKLLMGNVQHKVSWLAADTTAQGKTSSLDFLIKSKLLVFARNPNPTRRDPSFMKTFRPRGRWMVPGTYPREDGRGTVVKMDWSADVQATNAEAGQLFTIG